MRAPLLTRGRYDLHGFPCQVVRGHTGSLQCFLFLHDAHPLYGYGALYIDALNLAIEPERPLTYAALGPAGAWLLGFEAGRDWAFAVLLAESLAARLAAFEPLQALRAPAP